MNDNSNNKKLIAKNTIFLYVRMLFSMAVSLYTSREILATLGVEDFGIYGVVGGIVTMLSFLNSSMSGATSRFLTYEQGRGDFLRLSNTFSSALIVHVLIAIFVLILCETVGLWFLEYKIVIPEGREFAAHCVYQLSILSAMFGITQVPYNASIIAHEKMDVFAFIEILSTLARLFIVYLLVIGNFDKLIFYSVLTFMVSFSIMMIYRVYCIKNFEECKFHWIWERDYLKPLLSFTGWDLYGNLSCAINQQGINFLINIFFGVVYNAASGVANTVMGVLRNLCNNVLMAFRPQIIKQYSLGNNIESIRLMFLACKFSTALLILLVIPFVFEIELIMKLWLKEPPLYATVFCKLLLINSCLTMIEWALSISIHATGRIKSVSIFGGTCFLVAVPIIWMLFKLGLPVETAYVINIPITIIVILVKALIVKKYILEFRIKDFASGVLLPLILISLILVIPQITLRLYMDEGWVRLLLVFGLDGVVGLACAYFLLLDARQRQYVVCYAKKRIRHE